MCEYALRKHSESTGRVPRLFLAPFSVLFSPFGEEADTEGAAAGGSQDGAPRRERAAREGVRQLWFAWQSGRLSLARGLRGELEASTERMFCYVRDWKRSARKETKTALNTPALKTRRPGRVAGGRGW
jgi:hypothetical protein